MKQADLKYIGTQQGFEFGGELKTMSYDLYNVVTLSEDDKKNDKPGLPLMVGSTVTTASVWQRGYWPNIL